MEKKLFNGFDTEMLQAEYELFYSRFQSSIFKDDEHKLRYAELLLDLNKVISLIDSCNEYYGTDSNE